MSANLRWTEDQLEAYRKKHGRSPAQTSAPRATAPTTGQPGASRGTPRAESELERRFAQQIRAAGLAEPEREYYFIPNRNFMLDFAWPAQRLGVEIQGGAHRIKGKFKADLEKRALALVAGWRVLELGREEIRSEKGIEWLKELLR
jgi:very-short-patch-repair endonuclease